MTITNTAIYGESEAGRAAKIRSQVEGLISGLNTSTLDIAELLYEIKTNYYYQAWGFDTFMEYIKTLEIKPRKAQYLVRIIEVMDELKLDRNTYEPSGVSKLREITSLNPSDIYTNEKNEQVPMSDIIKGLVITSPTMELPELKEYVRKLKGFTGENELVWVNFCVKKEVKEKVIDAALELARKNIGSVGRDEEGNAVEASDGRTFELICADYLSDPTNQAYPEEENV